MVDEWRNCRWGDLVTLEYGKGLRGYENSKEPYVVYGTNGPIGRNSKPLCNHPGVIIGRKGAYRGVHYSNKPFYVIDTAFYLEPKEDIDLKWAYYELLTNDINSMDSGSAIPSTSRDAFYSLPVKVPPPHKQRAIASILSVLDDKIELNRQTNETLEAVARAVFKSWFVDFDPVRAKMEGYVPYGIDAKTLALFPDLLEVSTFGEIPKGWRLGKLKECCKRVENGGTPRRNEPDYWQPEAISWLTSGEVRQGIVTYTKNAISEKGLTNSSAKIWYEGTTVVALYGATAGQSCFLAKEMCANQACCGLIPADNTRYFIYLHISSSVETLEHQSRGSAQQNLSQQIVADFPTLIVDTNILQKFDAVVSPIFNKWINNLHEISTLRSIRDALLPKLLSGEIRVKDAEKLVEDHL